MELQDKIDKLQNIFTLHMLYEYPQIDESTRRNLAFELAILGAVEVTCELH